MEKKRLRAACLVLALTATFAFGGCDYLADFLSEYSEAFSSQEGSSSSSSQGTGDGAITDTGEPPALRDPDEEKVLLKTEVDDIGHQVAYYTDGTREDLGRVTPLSFLSPAPQTQYSYGVFSQMENGTGLCNFYAALYDCATEFHYSSKTLTLQTGMSSSGEKYSYYEAGTVNYVEHGLSAAQAIAVWKVFGEENPAFYWLDLQILYTPQDLYVTVTEAYASAAVRADIDEKIKAMAHECDGYLRGDTTLVERALTIYDYLAYKIDYAYEEDGTTPQDDAWAHNITGGALYGSGVCETYAQTFDYFCGLFGIDCMTVVGDAGSSASSFGGHAWNYIQLDGKWYAVDVTWGDQEDFVMRGQFGAERAEFNQTHVADLPTDAWGVGYQCALPTLAGELCPVRFGVEGGETEMLPSIDEAFTKMTDAAGRYEITLYPHTTITAQNALLAYTYDGTIYSTTTLPKVGHITFVNGMEGYKGEITVAHTVTLQCNITMDGLDYELLKWDRAWKYNISK